MALTHRRIAISAVVICLLAGGVVLFSALKSPRISDHPIISVSPFPDVVFTTIDGQEISIASLRGYPLVISLWASWCSLCEHELADLHVLQKKFGDAVTIMAVNRGESIEIVKTHADRLDASHNFMFVLDATDMLYQQTKGFSMPEIFFIDKQGMIRHHIRGSLNAVELERHIEDLLSL